MKGPKSELSLKRQIKAKQVWDLNSAPSLMYPTKILVWDSKILNAPLLKYPTKLEVWDSKILNAPSLKYPTKILVWD